MGFKNLKFSLDTRRIEKPEPVTTFEDYKPWNVLLPEYLEEEFPLNIGNAALIFFTHIGATDERQDESHNAA